MGISAAREQTRHSYSMADGHFKSAVLVNMYATLMAANWPITQNICTGLFTICCSTLTRALIIHSLLWHIVAFLRSRHSKQILMRIIKHLDSVPCMLSSLWSIYEDQVTRWALTTDPPDDILLDPWTILIAVIITVKFTTMILFVYAAVYNDKDCRLVTR
jgi:hypothetical protein